MAADYGKYSADDASLNLKRSNASNPIENAKQRTVSGNSVFPLYDYSPYFVNDFQNYRQSLGVYNIACMAAKSKMLLPEYLKIGMNLVNTFNSRYPDLHSYTTERARYIYMQKNDVPEQTVQAAKQFADKYFNEMTEFLEKRPENTEITFSQNLDLIKNEIRQYKHANCCERSCLLYDELNKKGFRNHAIVEIGGSHNYNSHVFNVIGLDENADISNPETWGPNAVIVDASLNKVGAPQKILPFFYNFLCYGDDNPMSFIQLKPDEMFMPESDVSKPDSSLNMV